MSYPSPYQPPSPPGPPGGYDPYNPGPLVPARRASVLLYLLGGLGMLGAACCIGTGAMLPRMMAEKPEMFREIQQMPGVTPEMIRTGCFVFGVLMVLVGIGLIVLAPFVRQGSKGATIAALIVTIGGVLFMALQVVQAVVMRPSAQGAAAGCMMVVPLALLVALLVSLIQALGASGQVEAMRRQYAQQYWQSAYQQQMYRAGGGGAIPPYAGFQPPPTPPPGPPPPPPQQQQPPRDH